MFRSIVIILRQLLNISKVYTHIYIYNMDGLTNTANFVHKMPADIVQFVSSSAELVVSAGGSSFVSVNNDS